MLTCQMVYRHNNCLNTKKPYAKPCRLCIENCPHQAISTYHEINTRLCTECGACMAVCPSDGFVDGYTDEFHNYLEQTEEIILNCPQAAPLGYEIPCLGILDRDLWLYLLQEAKERKVIFYTGKCGECPDKKACSLSVKVFKKIHEVWPDHPPVSIKVVTEDTEALNENSKAQGSLVNKPINNGKDTEQKTWREKGWKRLEKALPGLTADEAYDIPRSRQLVVKSMESKPQEKYPIPALRINELCTSCGVCASICPQKALTKRENGEELTLVYEPYKCVQCQRCVNVCNPKAMSFVTKNLTHRHYTGKILLHKGSPKHCVRCKKQVFDNSEPPMCIACASSKSDSLFNS